jgi:cation:H+ antiporter
VLVAVSTSLPEASTVIASVRLGRYVMAVSDIFGTNLFNGGLLFVVDAVYRGGPVLNEVGDFATFAALLGVIVSALFLVGLIERRDKTVLRMGYDSLAVLAAYGIGVGLLYTLK